MDKPFVIYRSSAGSGKTFTLALEYLKLALGQNTSYRSILAVTFTNKATKEMKSRIIEFLYGLAEGDTGAVRQELLKSTGFSDLELTLKAQDLLSQILHGYSYFSIMTIDSFFQKVIRTFARETGLQAGFTLELDQSKVLEEVVDKLLLDLGKEDNRMLTEWLTRFAEERVEEGKAWDFRRDIKELAAELFKENYKVLEERLQQQGRTTTGISTQEIHEHLKGIQHTFEKEMRQLGQKGLDRMAQYGLAVDDFAYKNAGVAGYFVRLTQQQEYDPKIRARQALEKPESWTTQSARQREHILSAVAGGLQEILAAAIQYFDTHHQAYYSALQLLRFIYTYAILKDIEQKLVDYKRDNDIMLISDTALFLKGIIGKDETPFIYEKMGTHYQHFLIDEFQDTSGLQWNNFRPLVENSLDSGNYNLVVGDVKQAIYRWRGGDWQLLLEKIQQDIAPWRTTVQSLNRNYRSKKNIVDFNNALFHVLPALIQQEMFQRLEEIPDQTVAHTLKERARIITKAYIDAYQYLPENYDQEALWQGLVEIQFLKKEALSDEEGNTVGWKEQVQAQLPALVENLQDQGYQLRDIAFLVRDKKDGKAVADTLMAYKSEGKARAGYEYEVISPESLFLESSLSVGMLLDLLRFLDNPYHMLAKGNILYKYQKFQGKAVDNDQLHELFLTAAHPEDQDLELFYHSLPEEFRIFRPYLNKLPLYELIENLIRIFGINRTSELAYLQAFQDAALEYTKSEKGDLHSFLAWWDEKGRQTSVQISEQVDAMRILTIHKAKGLQFKVVILPFCDWSLDHYASQQNIIWTYTDEKPFQEMGLMPLRYSRELIRTVFSQDYYEEMLKAHLDNLNLLYVATTRAEECLYAFASPTIYKSGIPLHNIANALYAGVSQSFRSAPEEKEYLDLAAYWNDDLARFILGYEPVHEEKSKGDSGRISLQTYTSARWRDRLMVQPKSQNFFMYDQASGRITVNQQLLLRDALMKLKKVEDVPQVLEEIYFERGIGPEEKENLKEAVQRVLSEPAIHQWYQSSYDLININVPLLTGNGKYVIPDRVMIQGSKAWVIGFDTVRKSKEKEVSLAVATLKAAGYQEVGGYLYKIAEGLVVPIA